MKVRSAKAKGKRLEKWIRDKVFEYFPSLTEDDVRVPVGSETGEDIKLSKRAREFFDYSVECKYREIFKTLYGFYWQASGKQGTPVLFLKMNREPVLAVIDAEEFFRMVKELNERKREG